MSERVYSLCEGHGEARRVLRWGVSRLGEGHDQEMSDAVSAGQVLGKQSTYVEWTPSPIKQRGAAAMQAQRLRNGRRRVAKMQARMPLFAEQIEREEFARPKYTLAACEADMAESAAIDATWRDRWYREHPEDRRVYLPNAGTEARVPPSPPVTVGRLDALCHGCQHKRTFSDSPGVLDACTKHTRTRCDDYKPNKALVDSDSK